MSTHTPGPWIARSTDDGRCDGISPDYHNHVGTDCYKVDAWDCPAIREIVTTDGGVYGPTLEDARLIAAAPDLLAACEAALNWRGLDGDGISEPTRTQLIAALAKAEGRTKGQAA